MIPPSGLFLHSSQNIVRVLGHAIAMETARACSSQRRSVHALSPQNHLQSVHALESHRMHSHTYVHGVSPSAQTALSSTSNHQRSSTSRPFMSTLMSSWPRTVDAHILSWNASPAFNHQCRAAQGDAKYHNASSEHGADDVTSGSLGPRGKRRKVEKTAKTKRTWPSKKPQRHQSDRQDIAPAAAVPLTALHHEIVDFAWRCAPSQRDVERIRRTLQVVQSAAESACGKPVVLQAFGSQPVALALPGGDLDLQIRTVCTLLCSLVVNVTNCVACRFI